MSGEKQINEMARVMANGRFIEPDRNQILLFAGEAEALYNAGYRKQSEVAKEIFEEIDNIIYNLRDSPFYSSSDAVYELTELKKKYTEE